MQRIAAKSPRAKQAYARVDSLQQRLVERMQQFSQRSGSGRNFAPVEWFRATGKHGGGVRYVADDQAVFNRASVNVSQVQYEADEAKALASATALSSIIHPHDPLAPSIHLHVSWTEMKTGQGYWRVMADLNPSIERSAQTQRFKQALETGTNDLDKESLTAAFTRGDRYFYIPALKRHRGVCHFYLENYFTDNAEADLALAECIITAVIDGYAELLDSTLSDAKAPQPTDFRKQLDYHSLYFFQVLTLDRGTTSGLLVHDQNDVGILGSLPMAVDKALIGSWQSRLPVPQEQLLASLLECLPEASGCLHNTARLPSTADYLTDAPDRSPVTSLEGSHSPIDDTVKTALACAVRAHYTTHPEALALQASGEIIPPTVANHQ